MRLKANVHMHTSDDPQDPVAYSVQDAVDHAARLNFDVLAVTCHGVCAWTEEDARYATEKGVLLLSGIEINVSVEPGSRYAHVLLVGAEREAEQIRTFSDLEAYRARHPYTLVIAPHPYLYGNFSLHELLDTYAHLFDAIEHSWFYSRWFNRNTHAQSAAERHGLPLVATSDTHFLDFFHDNYSYVDAEEKSLSGIVEAIRAHRVEPVSTPRRFLSEMLMPQARFSLRTLLHRLRKQRGNPSSR